MKKLMIAFLLFASPAFAQTSLLPTVERLRAEYPPTLTRAQAGELINRVAWEHRNEGWGLLKKVGGSRCPSPQGVDISCDILIHAPSVTHFDVLGDAEGIATPLWRPVGPCVLGPTSGCSMENFLAPIGEVEPPTPIPTPTPDPTIPKLVEDVKNLTQTLEALRVWADGRFGSLVEKDETLSSRTTTLELRVGLIESTPKPTYRCRGYINLLLFRIPFGVCEIIEE